MFNALEPSNGELARRLDDIHRSLQVLIGRAEYTADQRGIAERFENVHQRLEELRRELADDIRSVREDARGAAAQRQSWRTIIYTGLIPALVVLLGVLAQIWLAKGKG